MARRGFNYVKHSCGHRAGYPKLATPGNPANPCPDCQRAARVEQAQTITKSTPTVPSHIDPTTPAGSTREAAIIGAIQNGWTEKEIESGVRFEGRETFICPGCHRTFPRSAAMNASTAMTCPDCYDDFS